MTQREAIEDMRSRIQTLEENVVVIRDNQEQAGQKLEQLEGAVREVSGRLQPRLLSVERSGTHINFQTMVPRKWILALGGLLTALVIGQLRQAYPELGELLQNLIRTSG